jgi:hypothetical protein
MTNEFFQERNESFERIEVQLIIEIIFNQLLFTFLLRIDKLIQKNSQKPLYQKIIFSQHCNKPFPCYSPCCYIFISGK